MAIGALVFGVTCAVFGCSSSASSGGGVAVPDGGVAVVGSAAKVLARAVCDRAAVCSTAALAAIGGAETCESGVEQTVGGLAAVKGSTWDDDAFRSCAQRVAATPCPLFRVDDAIANCGERVGTLAEGDACAFGWQCATGACGSEGVDGCGACVKKSVAGDSCATSSCTDGFLCTGPEVACQRVPSLGEPCVDLCSGDLACLDGSCRTVDRTGVPCTGDDPFSSRECAGTAGLVCNPISGRCEAMRVAAEVGAPCLLDRISGTVTVCGAGLYCRIVDASRFAGECAVRTTLGSACVEGEGFPGSCPFPSQCVGGVCAVEPVTRCGAFDPTKCTKTVCGESCVDLQSDSRHCGACDRACGGPQSVCVDGECSCPVGQRLCDGACVPSDARNCGACGVTCSGATPYCDGLACVATAPPPSCAAGPVCSGGLSCCDSKPIPAGTFSMGRSDPGPETDACANAGCVSESSEVPAHDVSLTAFKLDTFEVTVARFREFVRNYPGNKPAPGAGANPSIANSGWRAAWDAQLAPTQDELVARLKCAPEHRVEPWTNRPGANENRPMNCVDWYTAFAFCAWDGGRLPTEAEWEYAAAGGGQNRVYPWGNAPPDRSRAVYECIVSGDTFAGYDGCVSLADLPSVGSAPAGAGRWGHHDLAGSLFEMTADIGGSYTAASQTNPGEFTDEGGGMRRGGAYGSFKSSLRAAARESQFGAVSVPWMGFRCAR